MGTTSEELKKLYAKLGGKDPKVAGFSAPGEILNAINEIPLPTEYELPTVTTEDAGDVLVVNEEGKWDKGEASGGLPEVTTDDNGDILQVVNGAWEKAAPSKDVVTIEATLETSGSNKWLSFSNYTQKQIYDLTIECNFGVKIVAHQQNGSGVYIYYPQIGIIDTNVKFLCIYRETSATFFDTVTFGNASTSTTVSIKRKEIADPT